VLWDALYNTLFTSFGLGYTFFYTTPLILTGLSVAVAFHCGLFNIGAEGQLYMGAWLATWGALTNPIRALLSL
jgi:simple sugar transport system permease protein